MGHRAVHLSARRRSAVPLLPVAQYPIIAPPSISVTTGYPGASPENLYNSVTRLIEEELNGAAGILNFESTSDTRSARSKSSPTSSRAPTPSMASVEVQNRIKRVEARLAARRAATRHHGRAKPPARCLQIVTLSSPDGTLDEVGLGDFMIRNVLGEIRRIPGVGRATLYSTERSLRIWIDPAKLIGFNLSAEDVTKAITAQNAQVASGVGRRRAVATRIRRSRRWCWSRASCHRADEFGAIVLRANPDGSTVRLRDVARIEIGGSSAISSSRGSTASRSAGLSVTLSPTGNALGDRERGRSADEGAVALLPGQHQVRDPLQHHAASFRPRSTRC
ncbi:MAG: efflux RND transporter permease subunit [Rhodopseudomonas palustris]|nr:efflux RND transporter permease subunit [Rhodopseudomonas palustris]